MTSTAHEDQYAPDPTTPPDWVLREAARKIGATTTSSREDYLRWYDGGTLFRALCDMILKHEQPPVDRKTACATQAFNERFGEGCNESIVFLPDNHKGLVDFAARAIELWEEGYGK